ncbi:MAG: lipoate--protein ligase [Oscillospiraceae bacterium]|nr:lipoate--protein ligase [Oscillospiraceae bacterium]
MIHYIETGSTDPCYNLAFEEFLLEKRQEGEWLMLWQNADTIVIGLNQNADEEINADFVREQGIRVVRRCTGGGAVYHDLGNLNYSFLEDLGDAEQLSIRRFTEPVCRALERLGISAETSGRNDILADGKKISGTAQRILRGRILHHGTLLFDSDGGRMAAALKTDPSKFESKSAKSVRSRVGNLRPLLPGNMDLESFRALLLQELTRDGLQRESLTETELSEIRTLAEKKYRSWEWTYGRNPPYQFRNRQRFAGGTLEVLLRTEKERIREIAFRGDYMAVLPGGELSEALKGVPMQRDAVRRVLDRFPLPLVFGGITEEEILSVLFDGNGGGEAIGNTRPL